MNFPNLYHIRFNFSGKETHYATKHNHTGDATLKLTLDGTVHPIFTGMKWLFTVLILLLVQLAFAQADNSLTPIGFWRDHLNYQNTIQVLKAGNIIYTATKDALFYIDEDGEMHRLSKANGLNDVSVSAIGWDEASKQIIIAYNNSNLDVLKESNIKNISDIKRSNVSGDKTIYHIYAKDKFAYLSTGIGIIAADLTKYEIKDTWRIGNGGNNLKISAVTTDAAFFYAATDEGLKKAAINSPNLSNYSAWQNLSGSNGLSAGIIHCVVNVAGNIIALKNDSLFVLNGNNWSLLYADVSFNINSITSSNDKLLVTQTNPSGNSRVLQLHTNATVEKNISAAGIISSPQSAITDGNAVWIADAFGGLSKHSNTIERFIPNGPPGIATGEMMVHNNTVYAAAGSVNDAWNYQYNRNGIYFFTEDGWSSTSYFNTPQFDSVLDIITLAVYPKDNSLWAGSYGGGLVNINGNNITIYKQNSTLQPAIGDTTSYRISGLAFDKQHHLWIANYGAAQNLHVRKADGSFKAFTIPFFHFENAVSQVLVDDLNQIWIVSPRGNGVFVLNYNNTIDNTADDKWKYLRTGAGNGNLPSNNVFTLAKDKNGFIWIGTDNGIGIVQCAENLFSSSSCEAILPVVQQDQFAGYLFQNEAVRAIAVDAANRKWIGTANGVWLISAEGEKTICHFTENNSPLLSNDVKRITVNDKTGEVFISTFKGIISFRSTATAPKEETNEDVLVFPNPVPPNYNGTIAIKGLPNNSIVKIAELNGRLVYQTRSLGGQAIWNGKNYKGENIASGVYLIIVRNDDGSEKAVTKIAIAK